MRELRLKYIIQMVSDIGAKANSDAKAMKLAQASVDDALKKTTGHVGALERILLRLGGVAGKSSQDQAAHLARLALRYQDVRKAAEGASRAMKTASAVGTGAAAGVYAVDRVAKTPMEYSARLAQMANTAYADRDVAGRISGKNTLNAAITAAIRTGGGSRDDAAATLDSLIASNTMPIETAIKLLPTLMRGSTASGASAKELGSIAMRSMQNYGIKVDQVPELLNMAMAAGQAGGFELRDMAKWLPETMSLSSGAGLTGMEGARRLMASMQASVITAGSTDSAGNNVRNLFTKINSEDTAKDFAKQGIDLRSELMSATAKGSNGLDAFIGLVDQVTASVRKDPKFKELTARLGKAEASGEETQTTAALRGLFQGTAVSKVVQDQQALMALVAELSNREYVQRVMQQTRTNSSALGTSFDVMAHETSFKRQQALNEASIAGSVAFDKAAPALNAVADTASSAAQQFPIMTATVVGATAALGVFTAALGASGLVGMLTGRAGNAGGVIGTAATVGAGAAASAAAAPFRMTNGGAWVRQLGGTFLPLAGAGIEAYQVSQDASLTAAGRRKGYAGAAAGAAGGWGGAYAGAALGTALFPGVGTLIGGAVGGVGGYLAGKGALDWLWGQDPARDLVGGAQSPLAQAGQMQIGQGTLAVNVRVSDERATATSSVVQPLSLVRIDAGSTNPAGYSGIGGRP
ncbi:phage tail tape measure protein [Paucibacter sp. O1-1]|nr:phage tail tape measure protein [Paucibacter sp. O1-1]MDA3826546.1 phage tail tape measure protein [Paucibacter sp. O1-1]